MSQERSKIYINTQHVISEISPLIFSGFAEHMGRCVYEGIYDPKSPLADEDGLRTDVTAALAELNYRSIRYPGGNFLSGYRWEDGVGPKAERPQRRDLAWQSLETNEFGTNEFMEFCKKIGTTPMMGVNMGTGTIQDAANLVEYCNAPVGTKYANMRADHGYKDPHDVRIWCVGNEMDGPWQIGHLDAVEYGKKAREAAKMMKWHDPSIELVLCGSSNSDMPTYPEWDRIALELAYEHVDYHSMHYYATNFEDDTPSYLGIAAELESFVDTLTGVLRYAKAKTRSKRNVYLSWDEWNVWYKDRTGEGDWTQAPHISEEVYNLEDALVVAQWMNVFLRKADVIKVACLAQIVNVISPITTTNEGMLKHTTYYPIMLFNQLASGNSLNVAVNAPRYETNLYGDMPLLDVSASYDEETGSNVLFIVNRSQTESLPVDLVWLDKHPTSVTAAYQLSGTDPKAVNTFENPDNITSVPVAGPEIKDGSATMMLPPLSFTVLQVEI